MVGIDPHNIHSSKGKKWLLLGMVWQLIKMFLYKEINLTTAPGLIGLLVDGEDIADILRLSPEQILQRWVNYQLEKVSGLPCLSLCLYGRICNRLFLCFEAIYHAITAH